MVRSPYIGKYFAGGNTAYGFYSLFEHVLSDKKGKLIILKGGPGTGKSSLMRNLGKRLEEKGSDVEYFYCSSDSTSLDGVASPSLKFAVIDGTPPHAEDPKLPGVYDTIINLGEFWDEKKLSAHRSELVSINNLIKESFAAAYYYLAEANQVLSHLKVHTASVSNTGSNNKVVLSLLERILDDEPRRNAGRERHLFAGAISPEGLVNHYESILSPCREVYLLKGSLGSGISEYLESIYRILSLKGLDLEIYHCALDPKKIDALVIPEKRMAITKMTDHQPFSLSPSQRVYKESLGVGDLLPQNNGWKKELLEDYQKRFSVLLHKGIGCIKRAKELQLKREPYYSEAMDFSRVKDIEENLVSRFLD